MHKITTDFPLSSPPSPPFPPVPLSLLLSLLFSSLWKAMEIMGYGRDCVVKFSCLEELRKMVQEDRGAGIVPLAIVGTAGSVNLGK